MVCEDYLKPPVEGKLIQKWSSQDEALTVHTPVHPVAVNASLCGAQTCGFVVLSSP